MRPRIEGTVARGDLEGSEALRLGKESGEWVRGFPLPVDQELLERGQERYGIFCAPCHGFSGYGDGMVARRALELQEPLWVPPTDLHMEAVLKRSEGELYHTIDRGIRNMPAYGNQISVKDRWAVVAWIRVLQRSQNARLRDLPAKERAALR